MNSCEISPKILGCKVVIETLKNGIVEGIVHKVNPSCDQVLLRDGCLVVKSQKGMYVSTGMNLPATYKIYAKDIKSSKIITIYYLPLQVLNVLFCFQFSCKREALIQSQKS